MILKNDSDNSLEADLLLNGIDIPLELLDSAGRFVSANDAFLKLVGIPSIRKQEPCHNFMKCPLKCRHALDETCLLSEVAHTKAPAVRTVDIGSRNFVIRAKPILDENGQIAFFVKSYKEITKQINALKKAEQASRAKSFFLASVSHELRTPLNAIIGFTELLRDRGVSAEDTFEYLTAINTSANALMELVNDVLDLSRMESGEIDLAPEKTDFRHLMKSVIAFFMASAEKKGLRLEAHAENIPPLMLDPARVRQILINLVGNAVKFTAVGGVDIQASFLQDTAERGRLVFSVHDTGPGIPDADVKNLTEPFTKLSTMRGTSAANNGTGLGLAVVKRLLAVMNGTLEIESESGKGSLFTAVLEHVECADILPAVRRRTPDLTRPLLLVDDVAMNLKVLNAICRRAGFTDVTTASSAAEAYRLLSERSFNMVMTDLWMPELNGEALTKQIRGNERLAVLPVLAVTADVEAANHFDMNLFDGVIFKPVTLDKIRKVLSLNDDTPSAC